MKAHVILSNRMISHNISNDYADALVGGHYLIKNESLVKVPRTRLQTYPLYLCIGTQH